MLEKYGTKSLASKPEVQAKRKKTNLEKYGFENPLNSKLIKDKVNLTNLEKYGVKTPFESKEVQDKIKKVLLDKYGVENAMHSKELRLKLIATVKEKYGSESFFNSEEFQAKNKETLLKKYGVENPSQHPDVVFKRENTMLERYGVKHGGSLPSFQDMAQKSKIKNGQIYLLENKTLKEISKEYNLSYSSLHYYFIVYNPQTVKELVDMVNLSGNKITWIEQQITKRFSLNKLDKKISNDVPYRPDFKLSDNVYLNVDGLYWHSEKKYSGYKKYHFEMREKYNKNNLEILQFREDEIREKFEIVCSIINNKLGKVSEKIFARKCEIKTVDLSMAKNFLNLNHLMGEINGVTNVGLYYKDELVSLMSYKIKKNRELVIERFCSKINIIVVGGFSKILAFLVENKNPTKILSWVDLRYGDGSSLIKNGFKKKWDILSWKWTDGLNTYNRLKCRANMDERKLSEKEYAAELGWYKIYDAGQRLYIK